MKDKVVIVTGGADGIGAACVDIFFREGAKVAILDYNSEKIKELSQKYPSAGNQILVIKCDVSKEKNLEDAVRHILQIFGRIDCVVHNAGVHPPVVDTEKFTMSDFDSVMNGNLTSNFILAKLSIPELKKNNGTMVFITSMVAIIGQNKSAGYCASKAGQIWLMKSLAIELAPNVRVNAVAPSNVQTTSMKNWLKTFENPDLVKRQIECVQKLNRMAEPIEIAEIVYFLASSKSSFITGQVIQADGGATLDYHCI